MWPQPGTTWGLVEEWYSGMTGESYSDASGESYTDESGESYSDVDTWCISLNHEKNLEIWLRLLEFNVDR